MKIGKIEDNPEHNKRPPQSFKRVERSCQYFLSLWDQLLWVRWFKPSKTRQKAAAIGLLILVLLGALWYFLGGAIAGVLFDTLIFVVPLFLASVWLTYSIVATITQIEKSDVASNFSLRYIKARQTKWYLWFWFVPILATMLSGGVFLFLTLAGIPLGNDSKTPVEHWNDSMKPVREVVVNSPLNIVYLFLAIGISVITSRYIYNIIRVVVYDFSDWTMRITRNTKIVDAIKSTPKLTTPIGIEEADVDMGFFFTIDRIIPELERYRFIGRFMQYQHELIKDSNHNYYDIEVLAEDSMGIVHATSLVPVSNDNKSVGVYITSSQKLAIAHIDGRWTHWGTRLPIYEDDDNDDKILSASFHDSIQTKMGKQGVDSRRGFEGRVVLQEYNNNNQLVFSVDATFPRVILKWLHYPKPQQGFRNKGKTYVHKKRFWKVDSKHDHKSNIASFFKSLR